MAQIQRLAVIGFDSISLPFLERFVQRGVMPTVGRLMESGYTTQTWPCYPMETATNWACLATGATPAVHGCNMAMPAPGGPLGTVVQAFPAHYCRAEQLWTAAHCAGKRSVIFDWTQSYPLAFEDGIVHVGEDGRPHFAIRALQEACAYTTHPDIPESFHVRRVRPVEAGGRLGFEMPVVPTRSTPGWRGTLPCQYGEVGSLYARIERGPTGCEAVSVCAAEGPAEPLFTVRSGQWSPWARHTFLADGKPVAAHVRAKLLSLSPDGSDVHLYLSEIYPANGFAHPEGLDAELVEQCGPYIIQCSRQQVVIASASDIETYFQEQHYMGNWYRQAAAHILSRAEWDLFMFKWHGPDWTNHLAMYMIDPAHALYDPARADEGWAYWDELMALGDEIVRTVVEVAGKGAAIALVSDHGGSTDYLARHHDPIPSVLRRLGMIVDGPDGIDWSQTVAYGYKHYVWVNTQGRFPNGIVEPTSAQFRTIVAEVIEALLDARDAAGRHLYRAVMPIGEAARMGVAGDFSGDVFAIPSHAPHPTREEFLALHPDPKKRGTWDWPRLNSGAHSDDSYLVLQGPGIRRGYRRPRPTPITSVAPTLAAALDIPVPRDADGAVLREAFA